MPFVKKLLNAKFYVGLFFFGLIFLVVGLIMVTSPKTEMETATATILNIEEEYDTATENYDYTVTLEYTDNEGVVHTITTANYTTGWEKGQTIEIKYDPENPENIEVGATAIVPYIALGIGALALLIGLVKTIMVLVTPTDKMNDFNHVDMSQVTEEQKEEIASNNEDDNQYYFHWTQGFKPSYIFKTLDNRVVFEAKALNVAIFSQYKYLFINHLTRKEEEKSCSHTVTTSVGNSEHFEVTTDSYFKINGVKCWDVLGQMGYSIEPHLDGVHVTFDVLKYGVKVATFERGGTNIVTGKNYAAGNIPTPGIYKITCKESDIEGVFMACFVVAKTYDLH